MLSISRFTALALALVVSCAAFAQEPTKAQLGYARDVVVISGMSRSFDAILPQFADDIRQFAVTRPELSKDLNEVLDGLKPELEAQKQTMIDAAARIYAAKLSEAELKEIAAFFKSASGQKYVASQPVLLEDMFKEMQNWTQRLSETVMTRVRVEMGKRGHTM